MESIINGLLVFLKSFPQSFKGALTSSLFILLF